MSALAALTWSGLVVLQLVGDVFTAEAREREVAPGGSSRVAAAHHSLHQPAQPWAGILPLWETAHGVHASDALVGLNKLEREKNMKDETKLFPANIFDLMSVMGND